MGRSYLVVCQEACQIFLAGLLENCEVAAVNDVHAQSLRLADQVSAQHVTPPQQRNHHLSVIPAFAWAVPGLKRRCTPVIASARACLSEHTGRPSVTPAHQGF